MLFFEYVVWKGNFYDRYNFINNCCIDTAFGHLIPATWDRNGEINYCVSLIKIDDKA